MGLILDSSYLETVFLLFILFTLIYRWATHSQRFWTSLNVPCLSFKFAFMNTFDFIFGRVPLTEIKKRTYEYFKDLPFGGLTEQNKFALIVRDPELIEQICIKDFPIFYNHGFTIDAKLNPLAQHLFFMEDVQWRLLRNKLSPAFSTGKLKNMFVQLSESSEKIAKYLSFLEKEEQPFDTSNVMAKFTIDFIASSAFGLTVNTMTDENSEFIRMVNQIFRPSSFKAKLRLSIFFMLPKLGSLLKMKLFPREIEDFFLNLVSSTIKYRENNNVERNDIFQLLMEIRKQDKEDPHNELKFDDELMAANCFVFFLGGYESISIPSSLLLYEVAMEMNLQEKIYEDVQNAINKCGGEFTYEAVKQMTYLDKAVSEILRKYPPAVDIMRQAKCDYNIPNTEVVIPKGTTILLPIYGIHRDPKYFPDPEKFDPDRFDNEESGKGTYMPFGQGPRMCIASRLALLEIKVIVATILRDFKVYIDKKTKLPLEFDSKRIFWGVKGGLWLKLVSRKKLN